MDMLKKGSPKKKKWDVLYKEAKAFFDEYGYFPTCRENHKLFLWARQWWRLCCIKNTLQEGENAVKAKLLTDIGFQYRTKSQMIEQTWWRNYDKLKAFYEQHGHSPSWTEEEYLHYWAITWLRNKGKDNPDKVKLLANIGYTHQDDMQ